ncbi:7958_t:CDS:1 [Ambispora gerdemannii]|uniref:7958_t:CDS:1 n=1 Tax=Ambispora gerdemannii TaxID=144530 RepID=A0A9N9BE22_9GLOM|nr:7958_t:CDS:1 [Ambispora gerdemannii]
MSSLAISGIAPLLDFAGLLLFVEKISIYLIAGATFYFLRTTFNEFLANCDARFLTELTDYRAKFNTELTSRDENFIAEIQRILTMLNTSTVRLDEIEQVLQNHHNNFGRVATEFESINRSITILQTEVNQRYSLIQSTNRRGSDQQSEASSSSARSSNSSNSSQKLANIISVIREQFQAIFDRIKGANDYTFDQMCNVVSADILKLGMGAIGKDTIKSFYNGGNIRSENLGKIGAWIDNSYTTTE